ncbi:MAG TPA: MFS transporter [Armatimonadota bacterium]|jgi:NNP family nitrate/nitrite transporter-like MFS transporter
MAHLREALRSGHPPTLLAAFLYFDVSFMVWVLLGPLGSYIAEDLRLSPFQKGLLVALPLLGGSLFRLVLGPLSDRYGGRRVGLGGMALSALALILGWLWAGSLPQLLAVALLLGVAGASFAVAIPLASRWYPAENQGLVLGIAAAGNSGTVLAALFAPRLAERIGWHGVLGVALVPLVAVFVLFALLARDSPRPASPVRLGEYVGLLQEPDALWFCLVYSLTFGGFVGLGSFLSLFFHDQYGLSKVHSGDLTTLCVLAGSFVRPVGGYLADRVGGLRMLRTLVGAFVLLTVGIALMPPVAVVTGLFLLLMALLGMGNGCLFQLVPQRYPRRIGALTGLVGAAGGVGGFLLPSVMGGLRGVAGSFAPGFLLLSAASLWVYLRIAARWRRWTLAAESATA